MSTIASTTVASPPLAPPAPVSGWRRLLGDSLLVSGATVVCHALAVGASLLLRLALDPAQMGVWQGLKLFLNYANYANLGVSKGAARELSVALGRGDTAAGARGVHLAFTVNTLSSLGYAAVLVAAAVWLGASGSWQNAWTIGLAVLAVLVVVQRHVTFHVTILRCRQSFALTSQLSIVEGLLTLALAAGAAWCWGLAGLYAGTLATLIGSLVFLRRRGVERFAWAWDRGEIGRLIGVGGPILLAGAVSTLFQSLDKLTILVGSTQREFDLGCYSLSLLVGGQLYGLANMLSLPMAPRYGELFGRTGCRRQVAHLAARSGELLAAVLALAGGVALVAAGPVLGRMLPDYRAGLTPALWLVPGAVALGLSLPASQYLVAVGHERRVLVALVAATALGAIGDFSALACGWGLCGVAVATSAAYAVYFLLLLAISLWPQLDRSARCRYVLGLLLVLAPPLAAAGLLERGWPSDAADLFGVAAKCLVVAGVWTAAAGSGWRLGGWKQAWLEDVRR